LKQIDEIIDVLLDQEGFECDPINQREGDTPLHSAVRWANEVPPDQQDYAASLLEMMLEAGSDPRFVLCLPADLDPPVLSFMLIWWRHLYILADWEMLMLRRIRNKAKLKALDLVDPRNTKLRNMLQESEYVMQNQGDFIDVEEADDGPTGSASDSE
jgi:hypothetical protein